jgi:very-short-patch-repair endonuclease
VLRLTDRLSLPELLARYPRRPGATALRRATATPPRMTRSELEHRFLHLLQVHGLPHPEVNTRVSGLEVDCAWAHARLIVELDGRAVHDTAHAFESDRERDRLLMLSGWRVARFTWRQLAERPGEVASQTRRLLALPSST